MPMSKPLSAKSKPQNRPEEETRAGVFIIESLSFEDEKADRSDGRVLRDMLKLSTIAVEYWYVRTWQELTQDIFQRFYDSGLRYLHLSCHGNSRQIALTLDTIEFEEFGEEISNYLSRRRLFVSACEVVNEAFSKAVNKHQECYSIIGPNESIRFDDAAIMWTSFYHLMLRDSKAMKSAEIRATLKKLSETFGITFRYL